MPRRLVLQCLLLLVCCIAGAEGWEREAGGHTKLRLIGQGFPGHSLFRDVAGSESIDIEGDLRFDIELDRGRWALDAAYQLFVLHGDSIDWTRDLGVIAGAFFDRLPDDDSRFVDLTHVIHDEGRNAIVHRLDRLAVGYTGEKAVVRFGRQALSWGNGLFYAPMDLVNPFDPATIDTEFKAGDDMLYVQYLRNNGDDVQGALVFRRNPLTGDVEADAGTASIKYHRFAGDTEYDLLVAESHGDAVLGIGAVRSIGGAVWRGDIVATDTTDDVRMQVVTNLSYSWVWGDKNVSGAIEYYFNGFGQHDGEYDPKSLAGNPELLARLARGELFTLGRHYLAGSLLVEMTPLWTLTPTLLANVDDPSALLQRVTQYSLADNMTLLGSLNIPFGPNGSEFGGIDAGLPDRYLSTDLSLFAQFAWYF